MPENLCKKSLCSAEYRITIIPYKENYESATKNKLSDEAAKEGVR